MKKILIAIIICLQFCCFSSAFAVEADSKTVRVGVYDNSPKIYKDANGDIKGFWADITNYIAEKEKWNLVYVYGTWDEGLARLEKGEIDLIVIVQDQVIKYANKAIKIIENVDNDKIRAIFEKLIDNAIFYTKEKGKISVSLKEVRDKIRFEVIDNGIGSPKYEQEYIFLRFYRATNATPMRPDASGLGLFIAKYFAERHGGKISFESEEGEGTTFWFDFPLISNPRIK